MASTAALSSIGGVSLHQAYSDQSRTVHRRLSSGRCQRLTSTHVIGPSHVARSGACLGVSAKTPSERATGGVRARGSVQKVEECDASATPSSTLPAGTKIEASTVLTRLSVGLGLAAAFALAPFLLPRAHHPRSLLSTPVAFASTAVANAPAVTGTLAAPSGEGASDSATSADAKVDDAAVPAAEETVETAQVMSTPRVTATSRVKGSTSAPADVAEAGTSATPESVQAAEAANEAEAPKVPASTPVPVAETPAATSEPAEAAVATSAPATPAVAPSEPAKPAAVKPAPAKAEVARPAPAKAAVVPPAVDVTGKTGDGDVIAGIKFAVIKGLNAVTKVLEPSAKSAGAPATSGKPLNTDYANPKFIYPFVSLVAGLILMAAGVLAQIRLLFKDDVKPKAPDGPLPFPTARLSNAPRPKSGTSGLVRGASFGERSVPPSAKFSFKAVPVGSKPASPPLEVPSTAGLDASNKSPQDKAVIEAAFASEGAAKATEVQEVVLSKGDVKN